MPARSVPTSRRLKAEEKGEREMKKVSLILVDGMRPDALVQCGNPYVQALLSASAYALNARTVYPSVTLPCHMSMFHSVEPDRHGVTDNIYTPMARPLNGIVEQLHGRRSTAMCYNWNQLRDLCRPEAVDFSLFISLSAYGAERSTREVCEASEKLMETRAPDFCFTYLGWPDEQGHASGWMSAEYMHSVDESVGFVRRLIESAGDEYVTILLADHGGHGRTHGTTLDEDMTIPVVVHGEGIQPREFGQPVSILDIAPTVVRLLDCEPAREWEGRPLV